MPIEFKGWWKCIPSNRVVSFVLRGRKVVRHSLGNFTFLSKRSPIAAVSSAAGDASCGFYTDMTGEDMSFESRTAYYQAGRYHLLLPEGCGDEWSGMNVSVRIEVIPKRVMELITRATARDIISAGGSVRGYRYLPYGVTTHVISYPAVEKLRDYDEFTRVTGDSENGDRK